MRLRYWWYDLRHRHQTAVEQRIASFKALKRIPEFERMQTKPKVHAKPKTLAAWHRLHGRKAS